MANGDITHIKELGRFTVPGGGRTLNGLASNNKVFVFGELSATYVSTGIALNGAGGIQAFGLSTLDYIEFEVVTVNDVDHASTVHSMANLARRSDKIFVGTDIAETTLPSDGHVVVLQYFAIGDSSRPDLT